MTISSFPFRLLTNLLNGIVLCSFVSSANAQQTMTAVVSLYDQVSHSGSLIKLDDVADIEAKDATFQEQLGSVILGPGPLSGQTTTLTHGEIRNKLIARGVDMTSLELIGQSSVRVTHQQASSSLLPDGSQSRLQSLILKDLSRQLQQYALRIEPALEHADLTIDPESLPLELTQRAQLSGVQFYGGQAPWDQWQQIQLIYQTGTGQQSSTSLRVRWTPWPYGLALRTSVMRGDILREDHLAWKQVPPAQSLLTSVDDVIGMQVRKNLTQGSLISLEDLEQVPLARRGEIVSVSVSRQGLTLRRQFKALAEGSRGDIIRLMAMDGKTVVTAKLIGMREAVIENAYVQAASSIAVQPSGLSLQQTPVSVLQTTDVKNTSAVMATAGVQSNRSPGLIQPQVTSLSLTGETTNPSSTSLQMTTQANRPMELPVQQVSGTVRSQSTIRSNAPVTLPRQLMPSGYQAAFPRRPGR